MDLSDNAERALRMVRESNDLSYDTETSGLDWRSHSPIGYVVGAPRDDSHIGENDVVYVPIRHGGGGNLAGGKPMTSPTEGFELHPFEKELAAAFDYRNRVNSTGRVVGHHIKFDAHMSANAGVLLGRRMACTQGMAAMLDEYAKKYSLEAIADRYEVQAKKGQGMYEHLAKLFGGAATRDQMAHYWKTAGNDPVAYEYAVGDGVSTYQVYVKMHAMLGEEEMSLVRDLENDLLWTLFRMERTGIRVDLDRVDTLRMATERHINEMMEEFGPGFNTKSPNDVKRVMEEAGHTDWPLTEKGAPSFTEKFLRTNDVGKRIIKIRQSRNLLSSFVNPLADRHTFKGRVHANLSPLKNDKGGAISGRIQCDAPNLMAVPKRNKEVAKPFRSLFVADEGHVFWERDYSQCEPRLFAHYSQDANLLEGYRSVPFRDAHQVVADLLSVERDPTAKRMNMGIFTGMYPRTFSDHMGWDLDRATRAWNAWFNEFPAVATFQKNAQYRLKSRGYVFTLLGRRGRLEHPRFAYRGTSKIIQGSNADILKYKLLECDRMCEDNGDIVRILMTVHDSFNGQRQDTPEAATLFKEITRCMEDVQGEPFNLSVPFVVEGDEGGDWKEATWGKDQ